jgi:hypothetical protein
MPDLPHAETQLNLREKVRDMGARTGWPALLLCSAAGTLAAALVVLLLTQVIQVSLAETYWKTGATMGAWLAGLLVAATVGFECGRRVVTARALRRLPDGYRLWFKRDSPIAEARRALDRWKDDTHRQLFMTRIRCMRSTAADLPDLEDRMAYFGGTQGAGTRSSPSSTDEDKGEL